ncbi:MAG: hypothetical protein M1514_02245 [Patescibacteria group bacterium]|nr:hypothetical protein [Patescibacteria group bacterium]
MKGEFAPTAPPNTAFISTGDLYRQRPELAMCRRPEEQRQLLNCALNFYWENFGYEFRRHQELAGTERELHFVPDKFVAVVNGGENNRIVKTKIGEIISALYKGFEETGIEGYVFLTREGARISLDGATIPASTFDPKQVRDQKPITDGDFVVVIDKVPFDLDHFDERSLCLLIQQNLPVDNPFTVKVTQSESRPFRYVEVGIVNSDGKWISYAQISFPEKQGQNYPKATLADDHLSGHSQEDQILLIERGESFAGIGIILEKNIRDYPPLFAYTLNRYGELSQKKLPLAIISPLAFSGPPLEAQFHALQILKDCSKRGTVPLAPQMNKEELDKLLSTDSPERTKKALEIAQETSMLLAWALVDNLLAHPEMLKEERARRDVLGKVYKYAEEILYDPYLGIALLGKSGETLTSLPVCGTDFIPGYFPEAQAILKEGHHMVDLLKVMEICPKGQGYLAFLQFFYCQANYNLDRLVEILRPPFAKDEDLPYLKSRLVPYISLLSLPC